MASLPGYLPHPVGWTNPVEIRASLILTANWVDTTEIVVAGAGSIMLSFTYTRGEAGGGFEFRIETSIYAVVGNVPTAAGEWGREPIYAPGFVVDGADTVSLVQREYEAYGSSGAAAETFNYGVIELGRVIERLRLAVREPNDPQVFGTLQITGELYT